MEAHQRGQKDPEADWDEHDYEKFLKECDARTDKYMELLDKYGDSDGSRGENREGDGLGPRVDRRQRSGETNTDVSGSKR